MSPTTASAPASGQASSNPRNAIETTPVVAGNHSPLITRLSQMATEISAIPVRTAFADKIV